MDKESVSDDLIQLRTRLAERYPVGLATIGNALRTDDNVAARVCDALPPSVLNYICRYDLGAYTSFLGECLRKHPAAIIIDATENGTTTGAITVLNMETVLQGDCVLNVSSSHGFSFLDELHFCHQSMPLPNPFFFFGIEAHSVEWGDKISDELEQKVPQIALELARLILDTVELVVDRCMKPV